MKRNLLILISFVLILSPRLSAIKIPLEGEREKVAYVNMQSIFEAYPQSQKARAELTKLVTSKKGEVTQRKEEIAQLRGEIASYHMQLDSFKMTPSTRAWTTPGISISTPTTPSTAYALNTSTSSKKLSLEFLIKEKEASLAQKETELPDFLTHSQLEIQNMEEGKTIALLASIYNAIEKLCLEGGYTIVLEKEHILYGGTIVDLTPKILKILEKSK